jgi:hypothetical protein
MIDVTGLYILREHFLAECLKDNLGLTLDQLAGGNFPPQCMLDLVQGTKAYGNFIRLDSTQNLGVGFRGRPETVSSRASSKVSREL